MCKEGAKDDQWSREVTNLPEVDGMEVKWCRIWCDDYYDGDNGRFKRHEAKARMHMKTKSIKQTRSTGEYDVNVAVWGFKDAMKDEDA